MYQQLSEKILFCKMRRKNMKIWKKIAVLSVAILGISAAAGHVGCALVQAAPSRQDAAAAVSISGDAELSDIMHSFIYGDVAGKVDFSAKERELLMLAVLAACSADEQIGPHIRAALEQGAEPEEIRETLFQTVPYIGYAKARPALQAMQEAFAECGVKLPLAQQSTVNADTRLQDGRQMQYDIFGKEHIDAMIANTPADKKFITDFLSANCFGDFYTRKVLDVKQRELITFVSIASLGGCEAQVKAHVQANLTVGNSKKQLLDAVAVALPYIGYPRTLNALACIAD